MLIRSGKGIILSKSQCNFW